MKTENEQIYYEPKFDEPYLTDWEDKMNYGYCGYGKDHNSSVYDIRDVRMLTNYFLYLLSNRNCRLSYLRVGRDHQLNVKRATIALVSTVAESTLCREIPVSFEDDCTNAADMAERIMTTCADRQYLTDQIYEVESLAEQLQFYFYAHIDDIQNRNDAL